VIAVEEADHLVQGDHVLLDDVDLVHLQVIHVELDPHLAIHSNIFYNPFSTTYCNTLCFSLILANFSFPTFQVETIC